MFAPNKICVPRTFIFFLLLLIICICIHISAGAVGGPRRRPTLDSNTLLVTKLAYFHSAASQHYDPTKSIQEISEYDLNTSISRGLYLMMNASLDVESQIFPGELNGFEVPLWIGSRELQQFLYMDTASSLVWVNCEPCGIRVPGPVYDPKYSIFYKVESCQGSHVCELSGAIRIDCGDKNVKLLGCNYLVGYGSGYSQGNLGRETFKFGKDRREVIHDIVFGCAHRSNLFMNGILGLGHVPISFISQYKASKFSYCIGDLSDRTYAYNMLAIGDKVQLWGAQTPISVEDKYYINLVRIAIGKTWLKFDRHILRRNPKTYTGGMVVDSGSTLSFIPLKLLDQFVLTTKRVIEDELRLPLAPVYTIIHQLYTRLCYRGFVASDLKRFPNVTFHFQNRAYMELTPDNVFQQVEDRIFCLAILPSEILRTTVSILGNIMQQNFNIAYDLGRKKLAFKRMSCKSVEDYYGHDEL